MSASISTPVRSTVCTVATASTPLVVSRTSISTADSAMGWQSGIRSGVFLAASTPASRAAASTSPFSTWPDATRARVAFDIRSLARATATRSVGGLPPTSTIFMRGSYPWPARNRSASMAAMQPVPAAEMACR